MTLQIISNLKKFPSALLRLYNPCIFNSLSGAISAPAVSHHNTTTQKSKCLFNYNVSCPVRWHRCACGAIAAAGTFFGSFFVQAKKEHTNANN
jgi:hypothetical protein